MKILYHIPYTGTTGAERWIYEGWKNAWENLGHQFFVLTASDDLRKKAEEINPNIFMTALNLINFEKDMSILKEMRRAATKIFLWVHWPPVRGLEEVGKFLESEDVADIYFGERESEGMGNFEQKTGRKYYVIPNAANKKLHFPTAPIKKYEYDIVYLGAKLPKKKWFFDNILIPLTKKYKVGIFGPYWTIKDNTLRVAQNICRKTGFSAGVNFFNSFRIAVLPEEENALYSSAKISLNFHERETDGSQPHYILNQRTFKIPACGGFQICDYIPALRKYFTKDEVVMARLDTKEWFEKIDYYLTHDNERIEIQKAGTKRSLKDHTYQNRVEQIMNLYKSL